MENKITEERVREIVKEELKLLNENLSQEIINKFFDSIQKSARDISEACL